MGYRSLYDPVKAPGSEREASCRRFFLLLSGPVFRDDQAKHVKGIDSLVMRINPSPADARRL